MSASKSLVTCARSEGYLVVCRSLTSHLYAPPRELVPHEVTVDRPSLCRLMECHLKNEECRTGISRGLVPNLEKTLNTTLVSLVKPHHDVHCNNVITCHAILRR